MRCLLSSKTKGCQRASHGMSGSLSSCWRPLRVGATSSGRGMQTCSRHHTISRFHSYSRLRCSQTCSTPRPWRLPWHQQERLHDLFPDMVPSPDAPEAEYPTPLMWAWALVRSRAFSCGPNHFAFVPFLDMANHAGHPNADFECAVRAGGSYTLRAACPLPAGAEVTISYAPQMDNQRQFAQYGFVAPGGNPHDTVAALADPTRPLCRSRLHTTLRSRGMDPDDWSTLAAPVAATLRCLPFASGAPLSVELEIENVMAHLKALEVVAASDFPTTLEADMSATRELLKGPEVPDQRRLALLMYRVERKLLSASARAILQDHLQNLQSDPLRM